MSIATTTPFSAPSRTTGARWALQLLQLSILLALLIVACGARAAAAPRASVDRSAVSAGDTLTLTIHVDDTGVAAPDFTPLQRDFELYGSSQSTQRRLTNGRLQSSTEWQVTLVPKRSGDLVIPALDVGGGATQPLSIRVAAADTAADGTDAADSDEPVFLEVQLDRPNVYVQQQAVLTVRVFHAIQLDNMELSEPSFDNASVRKIGETTFQRTIRGSTYVVHERNYAIFPQQPGELTIPELVFNAVQPLARRTLFDFPGQGRRMRKMSKPLQLHVKPIPKAFTGPVWLPATNLTLSERWSNSAQTVNVGDSITRSITVQADGLLASQLPTQEPPQLDNAKVYNDQPTLDDKQDARGVRGTRTENMALIPNRPGDLQLPEVRVVWWDVNSDSEKVAILATPKLRIAGTAAAPTAPAAPVAPAAHDAAQPSSTASVDATVPIAATAASQVWQLAAALFALAWLVTLYLYWRLRRRAAPIRSTVAAAAPVNADETEAFRRLQDICRAGDTNAARGALLAWARAFYRAPQLHTIEQVLQRADDSRLLREMQQLDNRLFGAQADSGTWNGENLLTVVRELRSRKADKTMRDDGLPSLYPT